jgi:transposase-like protein
MLTPGTVASVGDIWRVVPCGVLLEGCVALPKPYSSEFREDVVVARARGQGTAIKQIASDFGISESCLANWMRQVDV